MKHSFLVDSIQYKCKNETYLSCLCLSFSYWFSGGSHSKDARANAEINKKYKRLVTIDHYMLLSSVGT